MAFSQTILTINSGTIVSSISNIVMVQDIKDTAKVPSVIKAEICILEGIMLQKLNSSLLTSITVYGRQQLMS